jgi:eukaryotic-like serine/threonine-protein kinase
MIGKLIYDYKIESILGEGGMATVYAARNIHTDQEIAIKVLDHKLARSASAMIRFRNEATLGMALSHPNIAKVHQHVELEGHPCILMDKVNGVLLSDHLRKNKELSLKDKLALFRQILNAIGYAHENTVVHRDLKPSNIMVDSEKNKIYILDFGVARLDLTEGVGLTKTGMQIGSVPYMSPEQIIGAKDLDHRTDIYSLGLLLYEMAAGKPVYDAATENSLLLPGKIVKEPIPKINIDAVFEADLNAIISKAAAKKPNQRYQSCGDFIKALNPNNLKLFKIDNPKQIAPNSPWYVCYSELQKSTYYYNYETKKKSWKHPLIDVNPELAKNWTSVPPTKTHIPLLNNSEKKTATLLILILSLIITLFLVWVSSSQRPIF